jgi:hypothetical protein
METKQQTELSIIDQSRAMFELACSEATSLQIVSNFGAAFSAVNVVAKLREALSKEVMEKVFMPLMNTKVGFLTDRTGRQRGNKPVQPLYSMEIVRDSIIDAVTIGLLPTGNQFNIIAERMYPTKEGYTSLLRKIGVKYYIDIACDRSQNALYAEIPCKINYEHNGEKNSFTIVVTIKKDDYSSHDNLRGKAERRAKKALYEYITGCDFGDADERSSVVDTHYTDVTGKKEVLQLNTPQFQECVRALANGITLPQLEAKFEISQEVYQALQDEAMKGA